MINKHAYSVERLFFDDNGKIPNNPSLSVLLYSVNEHYLPELEKIFRSNGWAGFWYGSVFSYHHFHSNSHEVLAVTRGSASLHLGGPQGKVVHVTSGDIMLIPAGVGHKLLDSDDIFQVMGAYPDSRKIDLYTGDENNHEVIYRNIHHAELPSLDPFYGENGPLQNYWK
ncbi:cupin domain-containing protein [Sinobaca sp. H24]|uniref:cupin domain-containing protein n=1 Tax=Sinobaca sp. H24 TaxID=2923376 RepID=UPI00207936DE|nr:cupin domain-containing protein [Sinobaca sp. H24]